MSVRFKLENGKLKEYPTLQVMHSLEGGRLEEPYYTKCGLSFKKDAKNGACDHLDCAIHAAREEVLFHAVAICCIPIWMIVLEWYEKGDLLVALGDWWGLMLIGALFCVLFSISPARRWLELNEYMKQGTIHGRRARRL